MTDQNIRQQKRAKRSARVSENKTLQQAVEWAGSQASLAYNMGATRCQISNWIASGIMPARQAIKLEIISEGEFKAVDLFVFPNSKTDDADDADDF